MLNGAVMPSSCSMFKMSHKATTMGLIAQFKTIYLSTFLLCQGNNTGRVQLGIIYLII